MLMKLRGSKGFTIIELLIVIAVIAILVGIALPRFKGMRDEGNIARAKGELRTLQSAVESYRIHTGTYPATGATWQTALTGATPQIVSAAMNDPFAAAGTQYVLVLSSGTGGNFYAIYSVGPAANGAVSAVSDTTGAVTETNGTSCIYVGNGSTPDTQP